MIIAVVLTNCDELKQEARKFPTTCYSLINDLDEAEIKIRNILFLGAEQTLSRPVAVSAFGFFDIDKYTISSICSVVAAYTIVFYQFDISISVS